MCLVTGDRAEAEELVQESFAKVWERWSRVGQFEDRAGYLYRTAFNELRSRQRRLARAARKLVGPSTLADPFEGIEDRHDLADALRVLTRRQRAALVLTELLEFSSVEAATVLGVRPVTVRVLASQARARLREQLEVRDV